MSINKGLQSASNPSLMKIPRGNSKTLLSGIDFAKLEQSAIQIMKSGQRTASRVSPTGRIRNQDDIYLAMIAAAYGTPGNSIKVLWGDEFGEPPMPHTQAKVFDIIDKFWSDTHLGLYGQYVAQLDKKPKTKDVFKGKSTTHHYPWYRRGSKY